MLAFTNTTHTKEQVLAQIRAHAAADEIIKGSYWGSGKGCAVGCTLHSDQHSEYEPRFGIPQMLARLEDTIFEGLPNGTAKAWPERFMQAVRPGADLALVGWKFLHWLLTDESVNPGIDHPLVRDAVKQCAAVLIPLTKGEKGDLSAEHAARRAASAGHAAWSAEHAARRAASAESAENAAWSAARRAARSAAHAAWSAEHAARSAEHAARSAEHAAWSAARSAAYVKMADKLVELIEAT